jgi:hypothetical protein
MLVAFVVVLCVPFTSFRTSLCAFVVNCRLSLPFAVLLPSSLTIFDLSLQNARNVGMHL